MDWARAGKQAVDQQKIRLGNWGHDQDKAFHIGNRGPEAFRASREDVLKPAKLFPFTGSEEDVISDKRCQVSMAEFLFAAEGKGGAGWRQDGVEAAKDAGEGASAQGTGRFAQG